MPVIPAPKVIGEENDVSGGFFFGIDDEDENGKDEPKSAVHSAIEARRQKKEEKLMGEIDKLLAELDEQQQELKDEK